MSDKRKTVYDAKRKELLEEDAHYKRLATVFGTKDGREVLAWLLDLCGYWTDRMDTERLLGRFELGRVIFNHICVADFDIASDQINRRRLLALEARRDEQRRLEKMEKERIS